jgi:hypothetical protein
MYDLLFVDILDRPVEGHGVHADGAHSRSSKVNGLILSSIRMVKR